MSKSEIINDRFNNCMQCLACICDLLAICFEGLRDCARIVDCIAHIVFCMTAGRMTIILMVITMVVMMIIDNNNT